MEDYEIKTYNPKNTTQCSLSKCAQIYLYLIHMKLLFFKETCNIENISLMVGIYLILVSLSPSLGPAGVDSHKGTNDVKKLIYEILRRFP